MSGRSGEGESTNPDFHRAVAQARFRFRINSVSINRLKLARFAGAVEASTIDWTIFFALRIAAGPKVKICVARRHSASSASEIRLPPTLNLLM